MKNELYRKWGEPRRQKANRGAGAGCLGLLGLLAVPILALAQDIVPSAINYQGTLTDNEGDVVSNGLYTVQFRVWSHPTEVGEDYYLWGREFAVNVVTNGMFNVLLSDSGAPVTTPGSNSMVPRLLQAFENPTRYLGLTITSVRGATNTSPREIVPRQQLVSTPYALHSYQATRVKYANYSTNAGFATNATNAVKFGTFTTNDFLMAVKPNQTLTGNLTIVNGALTVWSNVTASGSSFFSGNLSVGGSMTLTNNLTIKDSATLYSNLAVGGNVTLTNNLTVGSNVNLGASLSVGRIASDGPLQVYGPGLSLDQQYTGATTYLNKLALWQSFTPGTNGNLAAVEVLINTGGIPWNALLRVYEGEGQIGTLLHEQPITGGTTEYWARFVLTTPVPVTTNHTYTLWVATLPSSTMVRIGPNTYAGGRSDYSSSWDYNFRTYMLNPPSLPALVVPTTTNAFSLGIGTNAPAGTLDVCGDMKVKSQPPVFVQRFTLGDIPATQRDYSTKDTGYTTNEWSAVVAGFTCAGRIDAVQDYRFLEFRMRPNPTYNYRWAIYYDLAHHDVAVTNIQVDVLFIRKELVDDQHAY